LASRGRFAKAGDDRVVGSLMPARVRDDLVFFGLDLLAKPMEPRPFLVRDRSLNSFCLSHRRFLLDFIVGLETLFRFGW
jgi:hypothetical protein